VTEVLYSDYARSVETAAAVRTELNEANTALRDNKPDKARASLQRVQHQLPMISETEGRTNLTARYREIEQIVKGPPQDGSALPPGDAAFPPSAPRRTPPHQHRPTRLRLTIIIRVPVTPVPVPRALITQTVTPPTAVRQVIAVHQPAITRALPPVTTFHRVASTPGRDLPIVPEAVSLTAWRCGSVSDLSDHHGRFPGRLSGWH
jgi:pyruvate/2-oxoglutarate dehydrogenase complex dihydrolipoamide acyltransferase (E2) component